jgi:hypothetical protein
MQQQILILMSPGSARDHLLHLDERPVRSNRLGASTLTQVNTSSYRSQVARL